MPNAREEAQDLRRGAPVVFSLAVRPVALRVIVLHEAVVRFREEGVVEDSPEPQLRAPAAVADDRVEALEARVDRLEDEVASLRAALESLRERRF